MKHSGQQFINLPNDQRPFPRRDMRALGEQKGFNKPIIAAAVYNTADSIGRVCRGENPITKETMRNALGKLRFGAFCAGHYLEKSLNKAADLSIKTIGAAGDLLVFAPLALVGKWDSHNKFNNAAISAGSAAAMPVVLTLEAAKAAGQSVKNMSFDALSAYRESIKPPVMGASDLLLDVGKSYWHNFLNTDEIPEIVKEGISEYVGFNNDLAQRKKYRAKNPMVTSGTGELTAENVHALTLDLAQKVSENGSLEQEQKDRLIEILRDRKMHVEAGKRAQKALVVQSIFALAQIGMIVAKSIDQEKRSTIPLNIYSFYASVGPWIGFSTEVKYQRAMANTKTANLAEAIALKQGVTEEMQTGQEEVNNHVDQIADALGSAMDEIYDDEMQEHTPEA